ncbi:hypothetical protein LRS74_33310 [Streptomyces sp. LX-29]|uniref:YbaK/EbsC family protein n=1 Tax=Streptomyces sp. LX-29 TaxID=2900152 RepID=UPI00240D3E83|nr:YbaK/EbsC family protein [Streptomyces sp. LX-29]WFB11365.1 hypothetical protein LRS74_33310 [Streptomyces sp. LX-29]
MGLTGVFQAPADGGSISTGPSTEHLVLSGTGQSTIVVCDHCGNRGDGAVTASHPPPAGKDPVVNVIAVALTLPDDGTQAATVAIRSDLQVSLRKVAAATGATHVALLGPKRLPELLGKEAGTLTPWDAAAAPDVLALYDRSAADLEEFSISDGHDGLLPSIRWSGACGLPALTPYGTDLHHATEAGRCGACKLGHLRSTRAVEVAHVFELGTQYSRPMNLTFTDQHGQLATPWMACSGIGITRCLQTAAELHRDHHGLRWKPGTGPADLHLTVLRADRTEMRKQAE